MFVAAHRNQYQMVGKKKQMLLVLPCISTQRQMKRYACACESFVHIIICEKGSTILDLAVFIRIHAF